MNHTTLFKRQLNGLSGGDRVRYIIFSDIHGNNHAFEKFLEDIECIKYDRVIFLGDFIGYYYNPEAIIQVCIDKEFLCLLGNHDSYFIKMLDGEIDESSLVNRYGNSYARARETVSKRSISFLRSLNPSYFDREDLNCSIFFCHGSPLDPINGRIYPNSSLKRYCSSLSDISYVIFGHTHHKMLEEIDGITFINPGSLGQQRDGLGCSYVLLDTDLRHVVFNTIAYDIAALEKEIDRFDNGSARLKNVLRRLPI